MGRPDLIEDLLPQNEVESPVVDSRFDPDRFLDFLESDSKSFYQKPNLSNVSIKQYSPDVELPRFLENKNSQIEKEIRRKEVSLDVEDFLPFNELQDKRRWSPYEQNDLSISASRALPNIYQPREHRKASFIRTDMYGRKKLYYPDWRLYYLDRSGVIPCVKRRERRQVLFARRKAGRRGNHSRRRWTKSSYFIC